MSNMQQFWYDDADSIIDDNDGDPVTKNWGIREIIIVLVFLLVFIIICRKKDDGDNESNETDESSSQPAENAVSAVDKKKLEEEKREMILHLFRSRQNQQVRVDLQKKSFRPFSFYQIRLISRIVYSLHHSLVDRKSLAIIYELAPRAAEPSIHLIPQHPEKVKEQSIANGATKIVPISLWMKKRVLALWCYQIYPMSKLTTTTIILDRCLICVRYVWRNTTKEKRSSGHRTRNVSTPFIEIVW